MLDGGIGGDGKNLGTRRHDLAHRLVAELHHRLDQLAVALLENALLLAGFDQRVHGFRGMLGLASAESLLRATTEMRESEHQRHRQGDVDQDPQQRAHSAASHSPRVREKKKNGSRCWQTMMVSRRITATCTISAEVYQAAVKEIVADQQSDGGGGHVLEHRHGERGAHRG